MKLPVNPSSRQGRICVLTLLLALQATAGILVVHARLDARIALRSTAPARENYRRAAQITKSIGVPIPKGMYEI